MWNVSVCKELSFEGSVIFRIVRVNDFYLDLANESFGLFIFNSVSVVFVRFVKFVEIEDVVFWNYLLVPSPLTWLSLLLEFVSFKLTPLVKVILPIFFNFLLDFSVEIFGSPFYYKPTLVVGLWT